MYNNWEDLEKSIVGCKKCRLCDNRNNIVFGEGNKQAKLMFVGEGPGADEDRLGQPFVGKAGQLMNKAFAGLDIDRSKVYITNIVKCRPPSNRVPQDDEAVACLDYLRNQVILVRPKIIVLLGSTALKNILGKDYSITKQRGKWMEHKGIMYMPTWHPAALLRDETKKIEFWNDRSVGKKAALITLICDILKGVVAIGIALLVGNIVQNVDKALLVQLAGIFVVVGHTFPIFFGFKGGKGVATALGVLLVTNWQIGLICLVFALVLMALTRIVALGSIAAAILFPVLCFFITNNYLVGDSSTRMSYLVFGIIMAVIVIFNHRSNIQRMASGKENRLIFKK